MEDIEAAYDILMASDFFTLQASRLHEAYFGDRLLRRSRCHLIPAYVSGSVPIRISFETWCHPLTVIL